MTVHALKNAIMEKEWHLLQGVPSKSLEIWKVSIAVESLRVKLADIKLKDSARDGVEKLGPRLTLGGAFPEPPVEGFLHIVVCPPGEYAWFMQQMSILNLEPQNPIGLHRCCEQDPT
jgi:hypothetical protein